MNEKELAFKKAALARKAYEMAPLFQNQKKPSLYETLSQKPEEHPKKSEFVGEYHPEFVLRNAYFDISPIKR